ncbi:MAG: hypothetical protein K6G90_04410 [Clostridia bacterium]|nr:hypothetical protein [Clostridia bacterium]
MENTNNSRLIGKKLYIIIAGGIASGKTTLALNLASIIKNCFYIDKDDLGPMARKMFDLAYKDLYDRQGKFFRDHVRDVEYTVTQIMALRGFVFNDCVIVNTPYTGEICEEFSGKQSETLGKLRDEIHARGGELMVVFISIGREEAKNRLNRRKERDPEAAIRTPKVYENMDKFLDGQNLTVPEDAGLISADHFFVFDGMHSGESFEELKGYLGIEDNGRYDIDINKKPFMGDV